MSSRNVSPIGDPNNVDSNSDSADNLNTFKNIIKYSSNILFEHDIDGRFTFISPQIIDILGYSPQEVKMKWQEMLTDNPINKIGIKSTELAIKTGKEQPPYELELSAKDGSTRWVEIREGPVIKNGKTVAIVGASTDITERKNYESKLKESEKKYRLLVENLSDLIVKFDLNGRLTYVSPNYSTTFGFKVKDIIGKKFVPEVHPDDIDRFEKVLENSLKEPFNVYHEERMLTTNGWRMFSWSNKVIRNAEGIPIEIVTVGKDITERKKNIDEINKLALVAKETDNAVIIAGLDKNIEWVNDAFTRQSGYKLEEVRGQNPITLLSGPETDQESLNRIITSTIKGEQVKEEIINYAKNGNKYWIEINIKPIFDENGNIIKHFSIQSEITERKNAEFAIKESERKYHMLTEISPVGIFRTEANGYTTFVNPRWCEISGLSAEEAIGNGWLNAVHIEDRKKLADGWERDAQIGSKSTSEYRFVRPDGEVRWVLGIANPELNPKGEICGYVGTITDITEMKKVEEDLIRTEETALALLNSFIDSAILLDENGSIIALNDTFARHYNKSKDELIGIDIFSLMPIEVAKKRKAKIAEAGKTRKPVRFEDQRAGTWFDSVVCPIFDKNGNIFRFAVYASDITEKKNIDNKIRAIQARLLEAQRIANIGNWEWDFVNDKMWWSDQNYKLLDILPDDILLSYESFLDIVKKEDRAKIDSVLEEVKNGENIYSVEFRRRFNDGSERIFHLQGEAERNEENELVRLAGTVQDITERKRSEEAIRLSEEKFSKAFLNSPNAITLSSMEDGKIYDINEYGAKELGYSRDEVIGKSSLELGIVTSEDRELIFNELKKNGSYSGLELEVHTKLGEIRIGLFYGQPITIGGKSYLFQTITDITDIRKTEKALMEQHNLMRTMIDALPLDIFVKNYEHEFVLANKSLALHHNFDSPEDLIGKTDFDLFPHKVAKRYMMLEKDFMELNEGFSDKVDQFEDEDGNKEWWNNTKIPLRDLDGSCVGIVGIHKDITDIIKTEEELRKSEERYRTIFESSSSGILIFDSDLNIIDANPLACKMYGYSLEEIKKLNVREITTEETFEKHAHKVSKYLHEGQSIEFEAIDVKKDGTKFWTNVFLNPLSSLGNNYTLDIVTDITDRKLAEKALKDSEERYRTIFNSTSNSFVIFDENLNIIEANPAACELYMYTNEEIKSLTMKDIKTPKMIEDHLPTLTQLLNENKWREFESTDIKKNGEQFWTDVRLHRFKFNDMNYFLEIAVDITARKKAEQKIQNYQKNLKSLTSELTLAEEKERRRIAVNLHDHLGQSLAMTKIKIAEAKKENELAKMSTKIDSAKKYIDDSIKNSRSITYELSPPVLYELGLKAAVKWRLEQIENEHNINVEFIGDSNSINLEENIKILLFRAIMEILNNSIKHSEAEKIIVEIYLKNNILRTIVSDNGIGFDPETAEKQATKKRSFGLFTIRERISFLNGKMKIISNIGKGTQIEIEIPY